MAVGASRDQEQRSQRYRGYSDASAVHRGFLVVEKFRRDGNRSWGGVDQGIAGTMCRCEARVEWSGRGVNIGYFILDDGR